ncbi:MAG: metallophosphoesterase [Paludibacteraceae bacterium]|nr:metallophosphoesterase [Paludibacteraceae bacterium]
MSSLIVVFMLYSAYITPQDFEISEVEIPIEKLPKSFDGFRIVQLSDIHLGSWNKDKDKMQQIIEIVNSIDPDMLVFTGDMVNNFATETYGWDSCFQLLRAKNAKFAVTGNHDYGDYTHWKSDFDRAENKRKIQLAIERFGFKLLLNEYATVVKDSDSLVVVGVENWGKSEEYRYSNLQKATKQLSDTTNIILLSHDPNHWDAEVLNHKNIVLTLSGHTHAAQSGLRIGKKLFSPASFIFKRWAGLYREEDQYLYVNRGVGYIGLPMMLGVRPEITLITLKTKI